MENNIIKTEMRNNNVSDFSENDLKEVIIGTFQHWKVMLSVLFICLIITATIVMLIPRQYLASAKLLVPKDVDVEKFNQESLVLLDNEEMLLRLYQGLRSEVNFRQYAIKSNLLKLDVQDAAYYKKLADVIEDFSVEVVTKPMENDTSNAPLLVHLKMYYENEIDSIEFVNSYISHTNSLLLDTFKQEQEIIKTQRLEKLTESIRLLRESARYNRLNEIARIEEENETKIKKLNNEKEFLVSAAIDDKETKIAKLTEALTIARALGIENPTPIDEFANLGSKESVTSIKLTSSQTLPLYLMGEKYLTTYIKTLKSRQDESVFIDRINDINLEIAKIQSDERLEALKTRESDDPFIDELPMLLEQLNAIRSKDLDFLKVKLYQIEKIAEQTGKFARPNVIRIFAFGAFLSCFLAVLIGLTKFIFWPTLERKL